MDYAVTIAVTMLAVTLWLQPWSYPTDGVFTLGGDIYWVQATAEAYSRSGPIGTDSHVAWPGGYSPWGVPQLGLLFAVLSWVLGAGLGLSSAMIVWVNLVVFAAVSAACTLYFFRGLVGDWAPIMSVSLACAMGASPFVLAKIYHINVAGFFLVPLAIGAAVSWSQSDRRRRRVAVLMCTAGGLLSPLWWVVVVIMLLGVALLPVLVRRTWTHVRGLAAVNAALLVGFGFQTVLYQGFRVQGALPTRLPWDSNLHGGHLVDLVLSSPLVKQIIPRLPEVTAGASREPSYVGLVGSVGAFAVLALVIIGMPRRVIFNVDTSVLADTTVAALLLYLLGGLGNLQAAVFVVLGGISPARVWSRLAVLLALLGLGWLLLLLAAWTSGRQARRPVRPGAFTAFAASVAVITALAWAGDALATPKTPPAAKETWAEYPALQYLDSVTDPCPVAQLPQDGFPTPRFGGQLTSDLADFYYRGFVPYILAPGYSWSFGSWVPGKPGGLNDLPLRVETQHLSALADDGYCDILFDKLLASSATNRDDVQLEGREIVGTEPDFRSQRFDVYLLR